MASKTLNLLLAGALSLAGAMSAISPAAAFDDAQKSDIEKIVHQYLIEHPEVLIEAQQALQEKQEKEMANKASSAIEDNKKSIFDDSRDLVLGNPKGDVTVVEFFDYNCTYCKHAITDMTSLIKADPNVRFVLKEFPILGQDSIDADKVATAFRAIAPEKYGQFHLALLGGEAHANHDTAVKVAQSLGVSKDQIEKQIAAGAGQDSVKESYKLADALGIQGTPAYIIGNELIPGAAGLAALTEKVTNVRSCGKAEC